MAKRTPGSQTKQVVAELSDLIPPEAIEPGLTWLRELESHRKPLLDALASCLHADSLTDDCRRSLYGQVVGQTGLMTEYLVRPPWLALVAQPVRDQIGPLLRAWAAACLMLWSDARQLQLRDKCLDALISADRAAESAVLNLKDAMIAAKADQVRRRQNGVGDAKKTPPIVSTDNTHWLTVAGAATVLGKDEQTVRSYIREKKLRTNGKTRQQRRIDAASVTTLQVSGQLNSSSTKNGARGKSTPATGDSGPPMDTNPERPSIDEMARKRRDHFNQK